MRSKARHKAPREKTGGSNRRGHNVHVGVVLDDSGDGVFQVGVVPCCEASRARELGTFHQDVELSFSILPFLVVEHVGTPRCVEGAQQVNLGV